MDVTIPTSWDDINIDTYINLVACIRNRARTNTKSNKYTMRINW